HWGDGSTSAGTVTADGGGFDVNGSHTYLEELTGGTFQLDVADGGGATTTASVLFNVSDAALHAAALTPPVATEGSPLTDALVFHCPDDDPAATATGRSAVLHWGDGSTSAGTVTANGSGFDVTGSHTYPEELSGGTFQVDMADIGGATTIANALINV